MCIRDSICRIHSGATLFDAAIEEAIRAKGNAARQAIASHRNLLRRQVHSPVDIHTDFIVVVIGIGLIVRGPECLYAFEPLLSN